MNFRKTLLHRVSTKALFLTTIIALAAIAAVGLAVVPSFNGASKAAIEKVAQRSGDEVATAEMLKYALNFKSAAGYQTLAAASDEVDAKTKKDVYDQFSAVTQLPCTELADSNLGGKSFAAGVYCVNNAQLASQMTVDAGDDVSSVFVFLVRGNLNAKAGAGIALASGAQAANVFFVADESATLAEGVSLNANIVAKNNINVDGTSSVKGRMISVLGKVNGSAQSNLGGGTGTVQICKATSSGGGTDISDRYYQFTVSGVPGVVEVYVPPTPVNSPTGVSEGCSSPIDVPVGPQVITELGTARLRTSAAGTFEAAPGTFSNFQLINVQQIRPTFPLTNPPGSRLGAVNLGARTAAITVVEGGPEGTLITRFTNVFAITGFIEICKQRSTGPTLGAAGTTFGFSPQTFNPPVAGSTIPSGGDPDVTGFFSYTVEGVYSLNQLNTPNVNTGAVTTTRTFQEFAVPVGGCTGNIAVTISNPSPTTTLPRESVVGVTEIARPGFFLETVTTRPFCDREVQDALAAGPAGVTTTSQPVVCPAPAPAANNQPFTPGSTVGTSIGAAAFTGGPSTTNGGEVLGFALTPPTGVVSPGNLNNTIPFVAATATNQLITSPYTAPTIENATNTPLTTTPITGLQPGETILGLDFRPANNQLYALGSTGRLYVINLVTAAATQVGTTALPLAGTAFGFDFNPTVDRIRVVSDTGQNLRVNPNDATFIVDTPLAGGTNISAAAYTNNSPFAATTALFDIDPVTGTLYTQNPANAGTLTAVGPLGVTATSQNGFDISGLLGTNTALASLTVGGVNGLYVINLTTGAATLIPGSGGLLPANLTAFAVAPLDLGPRPPRAGSALNLGGGYATVRVIEASAASETIVDFYNRSEPGTVKVCKIAGPGIALGTRFRFSVFGPFGTQILGTPNHPQFSTYGPVSTIVDVTAGDPATGGNCVLVPGLGAGTGRAEYQTFMNGTPVLVVENGISPLNVTPVPPGAVRTSRIRVLGPATGLLVLPNGTGAGNAGFTPNRPAGAGVPANFNGLAVGDTTPAPAGFDGRNPGNVTAVDSPRIGRVAFNQRPGEVVAEFTNFLFNPTTLKICKNVTGTLAPGGSFNFTVTLRPESLGATALVGTPAGPVGLGGALFPGNPTATASVISAVSQGAVNPFPSCAVVDGGAFPGGSFSVGQQITVVETAVAGTVVVRCDSPTNGGAILPATGAPVVGGACGFGLGGPGNPTGLVAGVNILAFTNGPAGPVPPGEGATAFDFDGDGKADASIFSASTGTWSYAASSKSNEINSQRWGAAADKPVAADYDGDGKFDYAVFRAESGSWYIIGSTAGYKAFQFGSAGDIPQPGDYDGDGKADAAVFRPSNGTWYMLGSRDGFSAVQFGITTDRPVAADYDGDGRTDQAVYRGGAWYLNKSKDGFSGVNWGLASDIPVPADYDGDGKTDISVYGTVGARIGMWYQLKASGGFNATNWGIASDRPVPADYDGDGKADISVYRSGMWYSLPTANTAAGYSAVELGNGSDTPVPAPLQ